ncbi:MAG TPA: hypothetical protein VNI84_12175 [Pyrinomonadaceae bacterium]|nr:hypothetical protein [Pyrinomonadaceae bacterium]
MKDAVNNLPGDGGIDVNPEPKRKPAGYSVEDLDNLFTYHAPKGDQAERYGKISLAAKEFARVVLENTPACADQTVAIRQIALARMMANATIAVNE